MSSVLSLHADLIQESSTFGSPEHIYTMKNGSGIKVGTTTAPTQSGANVGFFAFYVDDKSMNTYYIYNCSNQKWLTYTVSESYSNDINFVEFTDNKDNAKSFVVYNYADENYQISPLTSVGRTDKYLNWYNGIHSNPYDGETTLGLWQQDGATDAGSRWEFQEIATRVLVDGLYYELDVATRTAEVAKRPSDVTYSGDIVIPASISVNDLDFTVTSISSLSFRLCGELTSITIPSTVTSIASNAFTGCVGLTSIIVHEDNPAYDSRGNCNALIETASNTLMHGCDNTIIPNTVENIYFGAFQGCKGFTHIDIPNSVTTIGRQAFFECNLTSIFIPKSVTSIGEYAFNYGNFTSIVVEEGNPVYDSRENCNALIETASNTLLGVCQSTTIPNTIEIISANVFSGIDGLTHIDIPNSVTTIESRAFYGCDGLTRVEIPNSVTSIGIGAFGNCTGLQSVTFQSVTPPTAAAFINSDSSTIVYVPEGAASNYIGEPWSNYDVQEMNSRVLVDGLYYNVNPATKTAEVAQYEEGAPYTGDIVIPASISAYGLDFAVTAVGDDAFNGCSNLTSVQIPGTVTNIGSAAFQNCDALTTFSLPESVTSIGDHICFHCDNLATVHLNDVVTEVNWNAFRACPNLTSVSLGNSVETIGSTAFHATGITHIDFPTSLTMIYDGAFGKSQLQSVEIPASITYIGRGAFSGISTLTSITVDAENPNYAAQNGVLYSKDMETLLCVPASLEGTFVVPAFVRNIMDYSFEACTGLTSLSMSTATPPTISNLAFFESENLSTIYVPRGATEAYQIEPLEDFNIVEMATPESGKYYLLKSRATGNRVAIENAEGQVVLQENWITPETWTLADHGRAIWKAQGEGNEVEFQNFYSKEWLKSAAPLYQAYSTVKSNQSTYTLAHQDGNFFTLFDEELATTSAYMHADVTYNKVVRWDGANNINNAWEFVEVPADVVEELLAQKERNRTLEAKTYALTRYTFFGDTETFTDHGLIRNASFISTNKQETTEGPIAGLLDGDVNTFFHSTWSTSNTDEAFHYLQVDLGQAVNGMLFEFARRIGTHHNDAPKNIRLYATNDISSETWQELGTFEVDYRSSAFDTENLAGFINIGTSEAYRYVRFVVEETNDGRTTNGNLFFSLSEFGVWDSSREPDFARLSFDQQEEIRDAIATAKAELAAEAATQETINRLNAALRLISGLESLTDGETFSNAVDKEATRITYTRNFKNTNWQPWYVPFELEYDAISDNFDVAYLNDVHMFDDDNDGEYENWQLEVLKMKSGDVIQANIPYMIRAKAKGEVMFEAENTTLYAAESNSLDCSSVRMKHTFIGTYETIQADVLRENGCYVMSGGKLLTPTASSVLKPYRWYLYPEVRAGYTTFYAPKQILVFEKGEYDTTGIEGVMDEQSEVSWPANVYDLNGRLVKKQATSLDALPNGVYVINGVKVVK